MGFWSTRRSQAVAATAALAVSLAAGAGEGWADGGTQRWQSTYREGEPAFSTDVLVSPTGATTFVTGGTNTSLAKSHYATVAYDAGSGRERWAAEFPGRGESESGLGRLLAITPDATELFVTGSTFCPSGCTGAVRESYATVAYNAATGSRLWVSRYDTAGGGAHDMSVSPDGTRLYVAGSANGGLSSLVLAYDTATGAELWHVQRATGLAPRTAMTLSADGSTLFMSDPDPDASVCLGQGGGYRTTALDTADGSQLWSATYTGGGTSCGLPTDSAPSPDGLTLFVTGYDQSDRGNHRSETVALDPTTGAPKWATYDDQILTTGGDAMVSLGVDPDGSKIVLFGNRCEKPAFGCDTPVGSTLALDAATGSRVWASSYSGGGALFANDLALAPDGSSVYVAGQETMPCFNPCDEGSQTNAPLVAYDMDTGGELWASVQPDDYAQALAVSPDGDSLFTAGATTRASSSRRASRARGRGRCTAACGFSTARANTGPGPGARQDVDASVVFDGWRGYFDKMASGGAYRASRSRGDVAVFTTPKTSKIALLTQQGPDRGKAKILIDGRPKKAVDLYSATEAPRTLTFSGLEKRSHTIEVKVLGRKRTSSSGAWVVVDGFTYAAGSGISQETSPAAGYNSWSGSTSRRASGGSVRESSRRGATAGLEFSGGRLTWVTATGPSCGRARVVIDGKRRTVDLYSRTPHMRAKVTFKHLKRGPHRITITALGTANRRSSGRAVVVDALVVGR